MRAVILLGEPGFTIEIHAQSLAERKMLAMLKEVDDPRVTVGFRASDEVGCWQGNGVDVMEVGFRKAEKPGT